MYIYKATVAIEDTRTDLVILQIGDHLGYPRVLLGEKAEHDLTKPPFLASCCVVIFLLWGSHKFCIIMIISLFPSTSMLFGSHIQTVKVRFCYCNFAE